MNAPARNRNPRPERGNRAHTAWADSPPARAKATAQQARRNFSSAILGALVLVLVGVVARCAVVL